MGRKTYLAVEKAWLQMRFSQIQARPFRGPAVPPHVPAGGSIHSLPWKKIDNTPDLTKEDTHWWQTSHVILESKKLSPEKSENILN